MFPHPLNFFLPSVVSLFPGILIDFALKFVLYLLQKIKCSFYLFILLLINYLSISNLSVLVLSFHWSSIVRTEIDWEVITTDLTKKIVGTHQRLKRSAALIKI